MSHTNSNQLTSIQACEIYGCLTSENGRPKLSYTCRAVIRGEPELVSVEFDNVNKGAEASLGDLWSQPRKEGLGGGGMLALGQLH